MDRYVNVAIWHDGKLENMAEVTNEGETLENQLPRCQEEIESIRHQIMQVETAHRVS
jgi:hypothetical protein